MRALVQHCCNIFAVDAALCWARNDGMMVGAHMPGSSPAFRALREPVDPRGVAETREKPENTENRETAENGEKAENGENAGIRETPKTVKRLKAVKTAGPLPHALAAQTRETLKQESPPASRDGPETVKHNPGRRREMALCTTRETLKQRRKTQVREGLTCFTPASPAGSPETAPHPYDSVGETLKRPDPGRIARETVKHPDAGRTGRETLQHPARRPQAPSRAWGHETVKRLKPAPPPKRAERWPAV